MKLFISSTRGDDLRAHELGYKFLGVEQTGELHVFEIPEALAEVKPTAPQRTVELHTTTVQQSPVEKPKPPKQKAVVGQEAIHSINGLGRITEIQHGVCNTVSYRMTFYGEIDHQGRKIYSGSCYDSCNIELLPLQGSNK